MLLSDNWLLHIVISNTYKTKLAATTSMTDNYHPWQSLNQNRKQ